MQIFEKISQIKLKVVIHKFSSLNFLTFESEQVCF